MGERPPATVITAFADQVDVESRMPANRPNSGAMKTEINIRRLLSGGVHAGTGEGPAGNGSVVGIHSLVTGLSRDHCLVAAL